MRTERESAVRELIEARTRKLTSEMMKLPIGASEPPEEMLTAMIELDDLQSKLEALSEDGPDSGEPQVPVSVPFEPRPHLNCGAIALPVPDEEREF